VPSGEEAQTPFTAPQPDEDEAIVEDVSEAPDTPLAEKSESLPKMKSITVEEWIQANPQPPLWMRYAFLLQRGS
jgi:heat shock protein 90kDa beta